MKKCCAALRPGTTRWQPVRSELRGGEPRHALRREQALARQLRAELDQGDEHVLGAEHLHHAAAEVAALGRQRAGAGVHDRVGDLPGAGGTRR